MTSIVELDQMRRKEPEVWPIPRLVKHADIVDLVICSRCGSRHHRANRCPLNKDT